MASSYLTPPSTPSLVKAGIVKHPEHQNETSSLGAGSHETLTPTKTPSKNIATTVSETLTVAAPLDLEILKTRLGLHNGNCGSPTKKEGNPPCRRPNPRDIENQIQSMKTLTQTSCELHGNLEKLAKLALCHDHVKPDIKAARIKTWKKCFPIAKGTAVPIEPIGEQITNALACFPHTSTYTCVGLTSDPERPQCRFPIGGKRVRNGKRTIAYIIEPEHHLHETNLKFLLKVLAINVFCHHHTEQISGWVAKQKSCVETIWKAYHVNGLPLSLRGIASLPCKFEGDPENFWENTYDTSAFATEIEEDRPSDHMACHSLVREKMMEHLTEDELKEGYVYAYEVEGNEGFVKIGFTTKRVEDRLAGWKSKCDREPIALYPLGFSEKIPHANRVEGLCLAELKYRNETVVCKACPVRHIEWMRVPAAEAITVIEKWTKWIRTLPYEDSEKALTRRQTRNKITSWILKEQEVQRAGDMARFMQEITTASPLGRSCA